MAALCNELRVVVLLFLLFGVVSCGVASTDVADATVEISLSHFKQAEKELEDAIVQCDALRRPLPPSIFKRLNMSVEDVKVALYVLNRRAEDACENGARERLFLAAHAHSSVAKHYGVGAGDAGRYTDDTLYAMHWSRLEYEAKYSRLGKQIRDALESADELKVPFDIFRTLDAIE